MAKKRNELAAMVEQTHFRHRLFGGVDEQDAWRILKRLAEEYDELIDTERAQAAAILGEYRTQNAALQAENQSLRAALTGGGHTDATP